MPVFDCQTNEKGEQGLIMDLSFIHRELEESVMDTDVILIGEVGEIVEYQYPRCDTASEYSLVEFFILGGSDYLTRDRIAIHEITVEEVIKGEIPSEFLLTRFDVEYYASINMTRLEAGERLLFFIDTVEKSDGETAYSPFSDSFLFDLSENRAYPREPSSYQTSDYEFYHQGNLGQYDFNNYDVQNMDPEIRPYFEFDQLRTYIEDLTRG